MSFFFNINYRFVFFVRSGRIISMAIVDDTFLRNIRLTKPFIDEI